MNLTGLIEMWRKEPARIVGFVTALLSLLISFGVPISVEQKAAILGIVAALMALVQAEVTRANVYAPASVDVIEAQAFAEGEQAVLFASAPYASLR